MGVRHEFVSAKPDGPDPSRIQPTYWNAPHNSPGWLAMCITDAAAANWSNMPAAVTEFRGLNIWRTRIDLALVDQARLSVFVAATIGAPSSRLEAQYSVNNGASWYSLASVNGLSGSAGPFVPLGSVSGAANKAVTSPWVPIHPSARTASTMVRFAGYWGDGAVDPQFGQVSLFVL